MVDPNQTVDQASQRSAGTSNGTDDGRVGYRQPPRQHQFKKGQSGNRRGRQKDERNLVTVFKKVAHEKVKLRLGDDVRVMRRAEAVLYLNYAAAVKKNSNAVANMFLLADEAREFVDVTDKKQAHYPLLVLGAKLSEEEFDLVFGAPRDNPKDDAGSDGPNPGQR